MVCPVCIAAAVTAQAPAIAAAVATAVGARACASKVAAAKAAHHSSSAASRPPLVPVRVRVERGVYSASSSSFPPASARARPFRFDN